MHNFDSWSFGISTHDKNERKKKEPCFCLFTSLRIVLLKCRGDNCIAKGYLLLVWSDVVILSLSSVSLLQSVTETLVLWTFDSTNGMISASGASLFLRDHLQNFNYNLLCKQSSKYENHAIDRSHTSRPSQLPCNRNWVFMCCFDCVFSKMESPDDHLKPWWQ